MPENQVEAPPDPRAPDPAGEAAETDTSVPSGARSSLAARFRYGCRTLCRTYPSLLKTYGGRNELYWRLNVFGSPLMLRAARLYRDTLAARTRVIAVVGSYGKTTTTRAVRAALGMPPDRWTDYNANCFSLVPLALMRRFPPGRRAVIEIGVDGPGQMAAYARALRPDITVVTSIGNEHIQAYRDADHLRDDEATMVRALPAGGVAILNGDDPNAMWMATQTRARIVTFGFNPGNDVRTTDYRIDWPHGTAFTLHVRGTPYQLRARLIGRQMLYPLLAAAAVAMAERLPVGPVLEALCQLPPTPGRLQPIRLPCGATVLRDDYKATVETVHAALDVLAEIDARRRIVVLGGLDSPPAPQRPWHIAVGAHVARVADRAVFVGPGFKDYRAGLRRAGMPLEAVTHVPGVHEAAAALRGSIGPGDVLLVKGRSFQHLTRVILALAGRGVRCRADPCRLNLHFCERCPLLSVDHTLHPSPTP